MQRRITKLKLSCGNKNYENLVMKYKQKLRNFNYKVQIRITKL